MELDLKNLPRHVAMILDGNGRWAKSQGFPRTQGHIEGAKRAEEIMDVANEWGIHVLTYYTFSTENWNRPEAEVNMLMKMITTVLDKKMKKLVENNIQFQTIGRLERMPASLLDMIEKTKEATKNNTGLILNLALNYGSRTEIVDAVKAIAGDVKNEQIAINDIDQAMITDHLYTRNFPDPDLLIRTSGEHRISNFLLWQLSYSEFYFTEKNWPEFTADEFRKTLIDFQSRERRFGDVKAKK